MGSELVARLREMGGRLRLEAADLLEAQQAEIERLNAEALHPDYRSLEAVEHLKEPLQQGN